MRDDALGSAMDFLMLASGSAEDHVLPHSLGKLADRNIDPFGFGDAIPILNIHFQTGSFNFTNHMLMTLAAAGLCLLIFPMMARRYALAGSAPSAPRGMANFFESILQFIRKEVVHPVLGHRTDAYVPFLWTMFFFILFCNLLGMVPIDAVVGLISGGSVQHVGGTATGNLAITGGLAICSFLMIHVSGMREVFRGLVAGTYGHHVHEEETTADGYAYGHETHHHVAGMSPAQAAIMALPLYLWNFAPHVFRPGPDASPVVKMLLFPADLLMWAVLLVLELLGAVIKPFALMIRLFANMVAGHIVLASILMLIPAITGVGAFLAGMTSAVGAMALSCLELFVAFLQAYIFTFLTTLFIGMSVAPEH